MFHENPDTGNHLILGFLCRTEFMISGLFLWLIRTDFLRLKSLEACIFKEDTTRRKRIVFFITNAFIMDASSKGLTEIAYQTLFNIDDEVVFHCVIFFLPLYFSCCSVGSCGRWMRRSVPSIIELFLNKTERGSKVQPRCQWHHPQNQLYDCGRHGPKCCSVLYRQWHAQ